MSKDAAQQPIDGIVIGTPVSGPPNSDSSPLSDNNNNNNNASPVEWSRTEDDRLRFLRRELEANGKLPDDGDSNVQKEFLELERKSALFEEEGLRRLMAGQTPEDHHIATTTAAAAASSGSPAKPTGGGADSNDFMSVLADGGRMIARGASDAAAYVSTKAAERLPSSGNAVKAGWFYTSLLGTAIPAFASSAGQALGVVGEDKFKHWNVIIPPEPEKHCGGLLLGALPVLTEVGGSGGHLKHLKEECKKLKTVLGAYVPCLTEIEMEGFGVSVVKFATPRDWKAEYGPDFDIFPIPIDDCTANISYEKVMDVLTKMNTVMLGNRSVYVSCKAGKGRSWLVVVCFLIAFRGMSAEQATAHVKKCRHQVSPSRSQEQFVTAFYRTFLVLEAQNRAEAERMKRLRMAGVLEEQYGLIEDTPAAAAAAAAVAPDKDNKSKNDGDDDGPAEAVVTAAAAAAVPAALDLDGPPAAEPNADFADNKSAEKKMDDIFAEDK